MNEILLISLALVVQIFQCYYSKKTSMMIKGFWGVSGFTAFRYVICFLLAILMLVIFNDSISLNPLAILISMLGGFSLALSGIASLLAFDNGVIVLVNMAGTAGLLIPCIFGSVMFSEKLTWVHLVGIGLLFFAAKLLMGYNSGLKGKISFKTVLLLLLILLSNGATMLSQKMYTYYLPNEKVSTYSLYAFGFAAILLFITFIFKKDKSAPVIPPKKTWFSVVFLALAVFIINQVMTTASSTIPSIILFPVFNGGGLVLTTIMSAICFKEKLTKKSVTGLIIGVLALIIINVG